jgi:phage gp46-like protein
MSDVLIRQSIDGGEITAEGGLVVMSDGLESAAYLSLFGGNEDDAGDDASASEQWWGNLGEVDLARAYRSETQNLMRAVPAVPRNLLRFEQAAARDLDWMIGAGVAKSVSVSASIPGVDRVRLTINIDTLKERVQLVFG